MLAAACAREVDMIAAADRDHHHLMRRWVSASPAKASKAVELVGIGPGSDLTGAPTALNVKRLRARRGQDPDFRP